MDYTNKKGLLPPIPSPTDYVRGISSPIRGELRTSDWRPFITNKELQDTPFASTGACASFSLSHDIEMQCNWLKTNNRFDASQMKWFVENGYIDVNGNFNFSERALAKMSGTTPAGNTFQAVADCARNQGLLPYRDWVYTQDMTFDQFYAPIPQALLDKAKTFLDHVSVQYEFVAMFQSAPVNETLLASVLKESPVQIGVPIPAGHATNLVAIDGTDFVIYDQYDPFIYEWNVATFNINYAFRTYVNAKNTMPTYKYFKPSEIVGLQPALVQMLDIAREIAGKPIIITNGLRTPAQNAAILGAAPNSAHMRGLAVDLRFTPQNGQAIMKGLTTCGIPVFIEVAGQHIHVDIDSTIHPLGNMIWGNDSN